MPRAWAVRGENLVHAFEAVAAASRSESINFDLRDQALMLAGMAIEVQLKAIIVANPQIRDLVSGVRDDSSEEDRSAKRAFYSHRLVDLAALADVALSADQSDVAAGLTQWIYWRGRYVVPTERGIDDLLPVRVEDGLVGSRLRVVTMESARDLIWVVIGAVKATLYANA